MPELDLPVGTQEGYDAFVATRKSAPAPEPAARTLITDVTPLTDVTPVAVEDPVVDPETDEVIKAPTRTDRRLAKLWKRAEEATAENARLLKLLEDRNAGPALEPHPPAERPGTQAPGDPDPLTTAAQARIRPKPDRTTIGTTYPSYEDYVEDCAIWGGELAAEKRQVIAESQQANQAELSRRSAFATGWAEGAKAYPDFDQVLKGNVDIGPVLFDAITKQPTWSAHLAYYLNTHPDDVVRLKSLPPDAALTAFGEVLAAVKAARADKPATAVNPKPESTAPAPIVPVGRAAIPQATLQDATSYKDFEARRNAQLAARRR